MVNSKLGIGTFEELFPTPHSVKRIRSSPDQLAKVFRRSDLAALHQVANSKEACVGICDLLAAIEAANHLWKNRTANYRSYLDEISLMNNKILSAISDLGMTMDGRSGVSSDYVVSLRKVCQEFQKKVVKYHAENIQELSQISAESLKQLNKAGVTQYPRKEIYSVEAWVRILAIVVGITPEKNHKSIYHQLSLGISRFTEMVRAEYIQSLSGRGIQGKLEQFMATLDSIQFRFVPRDPEQRRTVELQLENLVHWLESAKRNHRERKTRQ
jgi:hypothetical protein